MLWQGGTGKRGPMREEDFEIWEGISEVSVLKNTLRLEYGPGVGLIFRVTG